MDLQLIEPVIQRMKLIRAKLNSYPQALHNQVIEIMTGESPSTQSIPLETIDFSKANCFNVTSLGSFTGSVIPCSEQATAFEINTDQLLALKLQMFNSCMKTIEALLNNIQQDPKPKLIQLIEQMNFANKRKTKGVLSKDRIA